MIRWIFPNTHISRNLTMPDTTLLDIPEEEQDQMLAALRRARYGYLLAFHVLLLCAAGRHPTDIAAFLFCSRSSVYRIVCLYRARQFGFTVDAEGQLIAPVRTIVLLPWIKRSLGTLLKAPPRAEGAAEGGIVDVSRALSVSPRASRITAPRVARFDPYNTHNCLQLKNLRQRYSRSKREWCVYSESVIA